MNMISNVIMAATVNMNMNTNVGSASNFKMDARTTMSADRKTNVHANIMIGRRTLTFVA